MGTYADMRARIADELANDGAVTAAQINNAILDAIADYEGEAFWFNQKAFTLVLVPSQEFYSATDLVDIPNMVSITAMRIVGDGMLNVRIEGIDNGFIEDVQDGTVTGYPSHYSRFENKIRFYPIPASALSIRISYITKFPALSADADTNAWTEDCEEMIRQAAKKRLAANILQADDLATRYAVLEKQAYESVRKENRLRQSQQSVRANWPFNRRYFNPLTGV